MSTNYYLKMPVDLPSMYIGKSSVGWVFSLRVYSEIGLNTLEDWLELFAFYDIVDEYGSPISVKEMLHVITIRDFWDNPVSIAEREDYQMGNTEVGCTSSGLLFTPNENAVKNVFDKNWICNDYEFH